MGAAVSFLAEGGRGSSRALLRSTTGCRRSGRCPQESGPDHSGGGRARTSPYAARPRTRVRVGPAAREGAVGPAQAAGTSSAASAIEASRSRSAPSGMAWPARGVELSSPNAACAAAWALARSRPGRRARSWSAQRVM